MKPLLFLKDSSEKCFRRTIAPSRARLRGSKPRLIPDGPLEEMR